MLDQNGNLVDTPQTIANGQTAAARSGRDASLMGRTTGMGHPVYEAGQVAQARARQQQGLGLLQAQALGQGPSVAQGQYAMANGHAQNAANAQMGSGNPLAARQAMMQGSQGMMGAALQGAAGRSQEQNSGMQAYGQGTSDLRGGDLAQRQQWLQQAQRDRALQLANAGQNAHATQGWNGLDADQQARLRNSNLTAWKDFQTGQDRATADNQDTIAKTMQTFESMMGSDARVKTNVRKGGK